MVKDAEAHEAEDKARREAIEARNQLDSLIYSVEKTLTETKDKLPAGDAEKVQAALDAAKTAVQGDDQAAITTASDRLAEGVAPDGRDALQGDGGGGEPGDGSDGAAGGAKPADGDVVDAEFSETK